MPSDGAGPARPHSGPETAQFWRDPALPFAESRRAEVSRACYRPHTHSTLSIGVVDAGHSVFSAQGARARLGPGTLVFVPPGCVHACNPDPGGHWSYQMLHLDPTWAEGALALHASAAPQATLPLALPRHALVVPPGAAYAAFCTLNRLLFSDAPAQDKTQAIAQFLARGLWRAGEPVWSAPEPLPQRLARVQALLQERPAEPWPLDALAQVAGMAPHTLLRAFRTSTGMTPHAYQVDLRINRARALLRAGDAPADVAHALGFYDQSHFQTAFKQRVAATPGHFRRR